MGTAMLAGIAAGFAIAVPVGAIGVLILDLGARRGFRAAFAAGSGTASADLLYASIAAFAGAPVAAAIAPARGSLELVAAAILLAIAVRGLRRSLAARAATPSAPPTSQAASGQLYMAFLGLTMLNPMTVTYFAALVLGSHTFLDRTATRAAFVAGAALASWTWQSALALGGSLLHRRNSPRLRLVTGVAGNVVIAALAMRLLLVS